MGESERQNPQDTNDALLQSLDADFQALQRHFAEQLTHDIEHLQEEKQRLVSDIEALRREYDQLYLDFQSLKTDSNQALSQQQIAQQNAWAKRLAQVLAQNLREDLHAYVTNSSQLPNPNQDWMVAFDETISRTLKTIQGDMSSYQSAITQQLGRMQTLEQQGEAILKNLVERLSTQLSRQQTQRFVDSDLPQVLDNRPLVSGSSVQGSRTYLEKPRPDQRRDQTRRVVPPYEGTTLGHGEEDGKPPADRRVKKGGVLVAIATLITVLVYVLVGGLSLGGSFLGLEFAGLDRYTFFQANALLWLQLCVAVPALVFMAPQLHGAVWRDLSRQGRSHVPLLPLVGGGVLYFFSQVFLFQACGGIGPAAAVPLLFIYPLVSVPLVCFLSGERPSQLRLVVMLAIAMGAALLLLPLGVSASTGAALMAAAALALHIAFSRLSRHCHPVTAALVHHATAAAVSSLILLVRPLTITQDLTGQLLIFALGLGLLVSLSLGLRYSGLRLIGGLRTALVTAVTPLLGALLGSLLGNQAPLQVIQWAGVALITIGSLTLALERLSRQ